MNISDFAKKYNSTIYHRGLHYWKGGRVKLEKADENYYRATVHGTLDYTTTVKTDGDKILQTTCNCPYGNDCKHVVALLCEIKDRRQHPEKYTHTEDASPTQNVIPEKRVQFCGTEMTESELFFLSYIAYANENAVFLDGKTPFPSLKLNKTEQKQYVSHLSQLHWIVPDSTASLYYQNTTKIRYVVEIEKIILVLQELYVNHPDWLQYFKSIAHYKDKSTTFLLEALEVATGKEIQVTPPAWNRLTTEHKLWYYAAIYPLFSIGDPVKILPLLSTSIFVSCIERKTREALNAEDIPTLQKQTQIIQTISKTQEHDYLWMHACLHHRLCLYVATGELLPLPTGDVKEIEFFYHTAGIQLLYENKLDEAITMFQKGLKLTQDEARPWKLIPRNPIVCLSYVIALGRRRNADDLTILHKMMQKTREKEIGRVLHILGLANYFQSVDKEKNTHYEIGYLFGEDIAPINRSIASLILCFFGKEKQYKQQLTTSKIALLQREMSPYMHYDNIAWNYSPALTQFVERERWELELEDIIRCSSIFNPNTPSKTEKESRIIYCVNHYKRDFELREQSRLKSGAWSKGRSLRLSEFRYYDPDDDTDKAIIRMCENYDIDLYTTPPIYYLLPYLKGTDRFGWYDAGDGFEPIDIKEEQPFLYTRREGNEIIFETNIPPKAEKYDGMWVDTSSDKQWVYYPMTEEKQGLFTRILALKQLPLKAEPMLKQLIGSLQGQIEVHSDIEGATEIEKLKAQNLLSLQIRPIGDLYQLSLCFFPLPDSKQRLFPTSGNKHIYDIHEDKRVEIIRDMNEEARLLKKLNALLTQHLHCVLFSLKLQEQNITLSDLVQLLQIAPEYTSLFVIEWAEGEKVVVNKADASKWNISANAHGGWFEIEGKIPLSDDHIITIAQLLSLLRESNGKFIRLSNNEIIAFSDTLRRQLERLEAVSQTRGNKVEVPELAMAVVGNSLQGEMEIQEPDTLIRMRNRIRESEQIAFPVPDNLNATLRDYQIDGFQWMMRLNHWGAGACLADDMGLGKTIQTIALMLSHAAEGAQMVVAPASVISNWQNEISHFAPSLNTIILNNIPANERQQCINQLHANDVLILTYGLLVTESKALTQPQWITVCLDEAHTIKNRDTKSSSAAMQLKANNRIILTGTPIQNHLGELWNLMQFINPGLLGSYEHFTNHFVNPIAAGVDEPKQQLKRLIAPFTLRRTKQEVVRELPEKTDIQVSIALSNDEMAIYEVLRREAKEQLEKATSVSVNTLSMITKLREAACSPSLVEKKWDGGCSKLDALMDKLQPIIEQGNRVLIFSQFTSFLKMAKITIEQTCNANILYLDGSTPLKERQRMVDSFQSGKAQVFLISLKAGGLGLNLTNANYVFHLDPWWNPAIEQQATDRAYRIGQKQNVTVYHLIAEHTIEEKILRLHQTKQFIADSLLEGTNLSHKLTTADLLALLTQ